MINNVSAKIRSSGVWRNIFILTFIFLMVFLCACDEEDNEVEPSEEEEILPLEFTSNQTIQGSWIPKEVIVGDFDSDDDLDILVTCIETSSFILWNGGGGWFSDPDQSNNFGVSHAGAAADLDGDLDLDLVLNNPDEHTTRAWINDGTGRFLITPPIETGMETISLALGDLDSDNDIDLYIGSIPGSDRVFFNNGAAGFTASNQVFNEELTMRVALGDLDGDQDLDAVIVKGPDTLNLVCINDGTGRFTVHNDRLGGSISSLAVAIADFDLDNDLDIFIGHHDGPDRIWLNNGNATFVRTDQLLSSHWSYDANACDLNSDGSPDLVVAGGNTQDSVWLNNGAGQFQRTTVPFTGNQGGSVDIGDLDLDGDQDVVFIHDPGNSTTGKVYIWLTTINQQTESQTIQLTGPCVTNIFDLSFQGWTDSQDLSRPVAVLVNRLSHETYIMEKGEELFGFILTEIYPDRVLMQNSEVTLKLSRGIEPTIQKFRTMVGENPQSLETRTIENIKASIEAETRIFYRELNRSEVKKKIKEMWGKIMSHSYTKVISRTKAGGLQFLTVPDHSIIAEFGIRNNDILTEINGFEIKDLRTLIQLIPLLTQENLLSLKIIREENMQTYQIVLK